MKNEKKWYVAYTKAHKEESAQTSLHKKGLDTFLPKLRLPIQPRRQRQIIPLFPCYLFVYLAVPEEYSHVRWTPGVKFFVGRQDPSQLDAKYIEFLRSIADQEGIIEAYLDFPSEEKVMILEGPFEGLFGLIVNPPTRKERINVLMNLLGREVKTNFPIKNVANRWKYIHPTING